MKYIAWTTLILITCVSAALGLTEASPGNPAETILPAAAGVASSPATIALSDGKMISGVIIGIEGPALVVRRSGQEESVPLAGITRVSIDRESQAIRGILPGALVVTYAANLVFYTDKNLPTAIFHIRYGASLFDYIWEALFVAGGGSLGYLLAFSSEGSAENFDLTGNEEHRQAVTERLRQFVLLGYVPSNPIVHLRVQAADVLLDARSNYRLPQAGNYTDYNESIANLNLLRKVQLTASLGSRLEAGAAVFFMGNLPLSGYRYSSAPTADGSIYNYYNFHQTYDSTGYYLVGTFALLHPARAGRVGWNAGLGVGAAKVRFNLNASHETEIEHKIPTTYGYRYEYEYTTISDSHSVSKLVFSAVAMTEVSLYLADSFSVGLVADYVFIPAQPVPAISSWDFSAKRVTLGSASLGVTLGFHI